MESLSLSEYSRSVTGILVFINCLLVLFVVLSGTYIGSLVKNVRVDVIEKKACGLERRLF